MTVCLRVCSHVWAHTCSKRLATRCICSQIWGRMQRVGGTGYIIIIIMSWPLRLEEMFLAHWQCNHPPLHPGCPVFFSGCARACAVLEVLQPYGGASWARMRSPESGFQHVYKGFDRWGGHAEKLVFFPLGLCSHLLYHTEMIVGVVWRFTVKVQKEKICDNLQRCSQQTADE